MGLEWIRESIKLDLAGLPAHPKNETGCYRDPLDVLVDLFNNVGGFQSFISFSTSTDNTGHGKISSPWDTMLYDSYSIRRNTSHIVLVDLYSGGATLGRSGTQSDSFLRVRFSNIDIYS